VSSRSSTSSDIDSLFPQRLGHSLYISDDGSKKGVEDEVVGDDGEGEFLEVDGDDEEIVERRAVCVFDFTAECEGEISIETGQVIWVEFRKGVSGWLVVRDEITGGFPTLLSPLSPLPPPRFLSCLMPQSHSLSLSCGGCADISVEESKGLVPEGYVRFLNEEEERQYLAQSPPTNTLLPRDDAYAADTGEETPRPTTTASAKGWIPSTSQDDWPAESPSSSHLASEEPQTASSEFHTIHDQPSS